MARWAHLHWRLPRRPQGRSRTRQMLSRGSEPTGILQRIPQLTTLNEMRRTQVRVNLPGQTAAAMKASGTAGGSTGPWLFLLSQMHRRSSEKMHIGLELCQMM